MTGITLQLTVDDSRLGLGAAALSKAAQHMRPMMAIAGGIFENSTRTRFALERSPDGIPWPTSWRAKETGGTTLQDRGSLRDSIRSNVGDNFVETGPDGRSESSRHAATHQFGAVIRPVKAKALAFTGGDGKFRMAQSVTIPARPFMGINDDDVADLRAAFVDYLEGEANGR